MNVFNVGTGFVSEKYKLFYFFGDALEESSGLMAISKTEIKLRYHIFI